MSTFGRSAVFLSVGLSLRLLSQTTGQKRYDLRRK